MNTVFAVKINHQLIQTCGEKFSSFIVWKLLKIKVKYLLAKGLDLKNKNVKGKCQVSKSCFEINLLSYTYDPRGNFLLRLWINLGRFSKINENIFDPCHLNLWKCALSTFNTTTAKNIRNSFFHLEKKCPQCAVVCQNHLLG